MQDHRSDVTRFIIRALADDYESMETLVNYYSDPETISFSKSEVEITLANLYADGYVQTYLYSESAGEFSPSKFTPAASKSTWFGLTDKGKQLLREFS